MNAAAKSWITVIGIGADGISGLNANARDALRSAELLVGGERQQEMVSGEALDAAVERLTWSCGIGPAMDEVENWRGRRVVVLASGDPMNYGAGSTLARRFDATDIQVIPHPGAFALACARMVWSIPDIITMTVHGRAHAALNLHLRPGALIVVLSWNGTSPAQLAALLIMRGFGPSRMSVFSDMAAPNEQRFDGTAEAWSHDSVPDLNTVCIDCIAVDDAVWWPRTPGLPEAAYQHDSQITKREVRAATIAALAPLPEEHLWDVGAGCGSVAIEWLRVCDGASADAVEANSTRVAFIRENADDLGVPRLNIVEGTAPDSLADLSTPNAIFVGGGVSVEGVLEACWQHLAPGGRLVSNAVTLQAQQRLMEFGGQHNGEFTRLSVARSDAIGRLSALRPMMDVLQLTVRKP